MLEGKSGETGRLIVKRRSSTISIPLSDIYYFESMGRKLIVNLKDRKVEYYGKISEMANCLGMPFYRVHRSFIVNMRYISHYERTNIDLVNGENILMSKYKYQEFKKAYTRFIAG